MGLKKTPVHRVHIPKNDHQEAHYFELEQLDGDLMTDYKKVGEFKRLSLSSHTPNIVYGSGSVVAMDPHTAIEIGEKMVEWGRANA